MYDWAKVILTSHVRFTWPTLDIEVNGRVRGAFRITRYAFISTVIHRAHVVNQELTAKVQRVNLSIFHLEFRTEAQPLASGASSPVECHIGNTACVTNQSRRFSYKEFLVKSFRGHFEVILRSRQDHINARSW